MTHPKTSNRTLFKGGTVLSLDPKIGDHVCADVFVTADRITAVGPDLAVEDAHLVDAAGMIVMPGLINAHQHAWLGLLRGLMPNVDAIGDYMRGDPADARSLLHCRRLQGLATRLTALVATGCRCHDLAGRLPQHA